MAIFSLNLLWRFNLTFYRCFGIRMIEMVSIKNLKCLKNVDMWKEQCSLSWTHINSIECSAITAMNTLFWEAPPVWIEFKSDNGKLGFEIRHIHWIFWEPNTLIRSPNTWVDNLPHDTEWKPKQTLWPGLDVVSGESGVSVASGLTFGMSPDVSVDVPGLKNIFL